MEPENTAIEHQNVPQAHQGLHGFLYSSDDEHMVTATDSSHLDTAAQVMPLEAWCALAGNAKVAGVYAVLGCDRRLQYIGYSRNVALSLKGHLAQLGSDVCALVQVEPSKVARRETMEAQRQAWLAQLDYLPSGNAEASELWASTVGEAAIAVMSAAERQAYEEKKLKLRKAMSDADLSRENETQNHAGSPSTLKAAIENDDWSAVIREQTQQT
ncbi:MAG: GIY-YIG nuclease family protein [Lyngbya sp. HA4199-MV5]|nr:GIY-YIG nuclease family protein [Lyngbya sp. HA4199-MV5]